MRKLINAVVVAIFFWPSICLGDNRPDGDGFEPIDKQEYLAAKKDFYNYTLIPEELYSYSLPNEFISKVIEIDDEAKCVYQEFIEGGSCDFYPTLFEINYEDTPIYMLEFVSPIWDFCYLATKAADGTLSVSDVKIDSAPVVFSKNGYIAGFRETVDGFWINPTIYTFSIDNTDGKVSVTKIDTLMDSGWRYNWARQHSVFWHNGAVYIEGLKRMPDEYYIKTSHCYYKLVVDGSSN